MIIYKNVIIVKMNTLISLFLIVCLLFAIYNCSCNIEHYSPFIFHFANCDSSHVKHSHPL